MYWSCYTITNNLPAKPTQTITAVKKLVKDKYAYDSTDPYQQQYGRIQVYTINTDTYFQINNLKSLWEYKVDVWVEDMKIATLAPTSFDKITVDNTDYLFKIMIGYMYEL